MPIENRTMRMPNLVLDSLQDLIVLALESDDPRLVEAAENVASIDRVRARIESEFTNESVRQLRYERWCSLCGSELDAGR